ERHPEPGAVHSHEERRRRCSARSDGAAERALAAGVSRTEPVLVLGTECELVAGAHGVPSFRQRNRLTAVPTASACHRRKATSTQSGFFFRIDASRSGRAPPVEPEAGCAEAVEPELKPEGEPDEVDPP